MNDTSPTAARFYHQHLRSLSPAERLGIAAGLSLAVRQLAEVGVRAQHPGATEREIELYLAARLYGRELVAKVLGAPSALAAGR